MTKALRMAQLGVLMAMMAIVLVPDRLTARYERLKARAERGGGRGSLEEVALAVGGIIATGVVVGAIALAIKAATEKLK